MKKEKIWILLILLLVFSGWSCKKGENLSEGTMRQTKTTEKGVKSKRAKFNPFVYDSRGKGDPFVPLGGAEEGRKLAWLSLEGILWKPEKPLAIINDQIVSEGDVVQGAEVINIRKDGVILRYGKEQSILRLK